MPLYSYSLNNDTDDWEIQLWVAEFYRNGQAACGGSMPLAVRLAPQEIIEDQINPPCDADSYVCKANIRHVPSGKTYTNQWPPRTIRPSKRHLGLRFYIKSRGQTFEAKLQDEGLDPGIDIPTFEEKDKQ